MILLAVPGSLGFNGRETLARQASRDGDCARRKDSHVAVCSYRILF